MAALTPMMEQYVKIKDQHPYCIVFFRLGDFYEMFFDDALIASRELELTLTGRDSSGGERIPMCGVPYHSVDGYIARLVAKGYKVAICEQTEEPKSVKTLVKREVVRIVTPGTIQDQGALSRDENNFILSVCEEGNRFGLSIADVTTGDFSAYSVPKKTQRLLDELTRLAPAEVVAASCSAAPEIEALLKIKLTEAERRSFNHEDAKNILCAHFGTFNLEGFGLESDKAAVCAAGGLLRYLQDTQKNALSHITAVRLYQSNEYVAIDAASRRNLELCETLREKKKYGSLLWVLDKTKTAMGARTLRKWIMEPLSDKNKIETRLGAVGEFVQNAFLRDELRDVLQNIGDMERIMGRVIYGSANARDLLALKRSFEALPRIKALLAPCESSLNKYFYNEIDPLEDLDALIGASICDEPPASVREGGFIRDGYNSELDSHRKAKSQGAGWILEMEARERESTGIKNLRIKYNKIFGYSIEVTKSYQRLVPKHYIRAQTLANCERYAIAELKEIEGQILGADERITSLELELFNSICGRLSSEIKRVQQSALMAAVIDSLQSLAEAAAANRYTCPKINDRGELDIKEGRHPVVEQLSTQPFIPNDTYMNLESDRLLTITGPNMAGKSTYMRQVALIVLMAHIGSFVPAASADICAVDKIFTRVGASDDLATGQSTFMIEMAEVSNILNNATPNSLIILDEIGRGTSTYDGMSIAWAVLEYVSNTEAIGAKTLFATHYHELTELEGKVPGVVNYCVQVKESGENIIFLRKIKRGGADKSYGIHVARLAGLPVHVISRAMEIMDALSDSTAKKLAQPPQDIDPNDVVYYGMARRKGIPGNRLLIEQKEQPSQITLRDILKNI